MRCTDEIRRMLSNENMFSCHIFLTKDELEFETEIKMEEEQVSEELKAIDWLRAKTISYESRSEELHYALILYNLIMNLQQENEELKKQLKIKHDGFMASVEESCELAEENQKYKEVIDKAIEYINLIVLSETLNGEPVLFKEEAEGQYLLDILKEVE